MVYDQIETNMGIDVGIVEGNLHAICEIRDGVECTLVHDRLINLGLAYILVCHDSKLAVVKVDRPFWMNTHNPRKW